MSTDTPRQSLERINRCVHAMVPVVGIPAVVLAFLIESAGHDVADWLEQVAHFSRFGAAHTSDRLVDIWAGYYLAGHIPFDVYKESPQSMLGEWSPLAKYPLTDADKRDALEILESEQWQATARKDTLSLVL